MKKKYAKDLDECIEYLRKGLNYENYVHLDPGIDTHIDQLIHAGTVISSVQKAAPTIEFKRTSKNRLLARIKHENAEKIDGSPAKTKNLFHEIKQTFLNIFTKPVRVAVPIALSLLIAIGGGAFFSGLVSFSSPTAVLASNCTLSIIEGNVDILPTGSKTWQEGIDGTTLEEGTLVKTASDSKAMVTFFEGSTIELDANTELEIECLEQSSQGYNIILLKQTLGRTWSRVVALTDVKSRYEVETPSSCAMVRGTIFLTQVDDQGSTKVQVAEGLVVVSAQEKEEHVPAGHEVNVTFGESPDPSSPVQEFLSVPSDSPNHGTNDKGNDAGRGSNGNGNGDNGDNGNGGGNGNGNGG
ncbi:MAG: FecR family protein, partial [Dehalococcoidia bacterium]